MSAGADDCAVVVVGAGAVGLACAYSLASRGLAPLVLEAGEPGDGASWGNAGWIAFAPEVVAPVAAPGAVRTSLRWLLKRNSPLRLVPRVELDYLRWCMRFARSCSARTAGAGLRATLALNERTAGLFDALERDGVDFGMKRSGLLVVFRSRGRLEAARRALTEVDVAARVLGHDETLAAEPSLRAAACAGAVRFEADRHVRPDRLVQALVARSTQLGAEIRPRTPCLGIVRSGSRIVGVRTPSGTIRGRDYVLAAGVGIPALARQAGARIPIESGRGFSFDVPRDALPVRSPVKLHEGRVVLTPFDGVTRVAGMLELGGRVATVSRRAIATMNHVGASAFRTWPRGDVRDAWAGLRPMTPDGLPVIGRVDGLENLYVAGGHGMLGVTLCLATGEAIAEMIGPGATRDPVLEPFAAHRFSRRGSDR